MNEALPPFVAEEAATKPIKCIVWDLDNTLWQGTLAEGDELEVIPGVVEVIQSLDARGILHSIASKNQFDEAMAKLAELGLDHYFLYPQISWNAKSIALGTLQQQLNIALDSFLFIDDQRFEREEVKAAHPQVQCLDASAYRSLPQLKRIREAQVSDDAGLRRLRYQQEITRQRCETAFCGTPDAFLASLEMVFTISKAEPRDLLRAEELTVRTNQLNSTGITYSARELAAYMQAETHELWVCELADKYGSYGRIGLALVEIRSGIDRIKLLLMSCRVASRGVGTVLLSFLAKTARARNHRLQAEFRRTTRNRQMLATYQFARFTLISQSADGTVLFEKELRHASAYPDYIHVLTD